MYLYVYIVPSEMMKNKKINWQRRAVRVDWLICGVIDILPSTTPQPTKLNPHPWYCEKLPVG